MLREILKFVSILSACLSIGLVFTGSILTMVHAQETLEKSDGHQNKLSPYSGEPPEVVLDEHELKSLAKGQAVFKKLNLENTKRGLAVFRVNADTQTIWSVIKDFKSYPQWIEYIDETEIYKQEAENIYVKFVASGLLGDIVWYIVHNYPQDITRNERDWGTWKLDYNNRSDINGSVGFWRVVPVVDDPKKSDVIYSVDLRLKGFFVSLFEASLITSGLKDATQWVKVQAEAKILP